MTCSDQVQGSECDASESTRVDANSGARSVAHERGSEGDPSDSALSVESNVGVLQSESMDHSYVKPFSKQHESNTGDRIGQNARDDPQGIDQPLGVDDVGFTGCSLSTSRCDTENTTTDGREPAVVPVTKTTTTTGNAANHSPITVPPPLLETQSISPSLQFTGGLGHETPRIASPRYRVEISPLSPRRTDIPSLIPKQSSYNFNDLHRHISSLMQALSRGHDVDTCDFVVCIERFFSLLQSRNTDLSAAIQEMTRIIQEKDTQLEEARTSAKAAGFRVRQLEGELESLRRQQGRDAEIETLRDSLAQARATAVEAEGSAANAAGELEELRRVSSAEAEKFRQALDDLTNETTALKDELEQSHIQTHGAEARLAEAYDKLTALTHQAEELQNQLEAQSAENDERERELRASLDQARGDKELADEQFTEEIAHYKTALNELQLTKDTQERRLDQLESACQELEAQLEQLTHDAAQSSEQLRESEERVSQLESEKEQLIVRQEAERTEMSQNMAAAQSRAEKLERDLKEAESFRSKCAELEQQLTGIQENIQEAQHQCEISRAIEDENATLRSARDEAVRDGFELKAQLRETGVLLEQVTKEADGLRDRGQELEMELEAMCTQFRELSARYATEHAELEQLSVQAQEFDEGRIRLQEADDKISSLRRRIAQLSEECDSNTPRIAAHEQARQQAEEALTQALAEKEVAEAAAKKSQADLHQLTIDLRVAQEKLARSVTIQAETQEKLDNELRNVQDIMAENWRLRERLERVPLQTPLSSSQKLQEHCEEEAKLRAQLATSQKNEARITTRCAQLQDQLRAQQQKWSEELQQQSEELQQKAQRLHEVEAENVQLRSQVTRAKLDLQSQLHDMEQDNQRKLDAERYAMDSARSNENCDEIAMLRARLSFSEDKLREVIDTATSVCEEEGLQPIRPGQSAAAAVAFVIRSLSAARSDDRVIVTELQSQLSNTRAQLAEVMAQNETMHGLLNESASPPPLVLAVKDLPAGSDARLRAATERAAFLEQQLQELTSQTQERLADLHKQLLSERGRAESAIAAKEELERQASHQRSAIIQSISQLEETSERRDSPELISSISHARRCSRDSSFTLTPTDPQQRATLAACVEPMPLEGSLDEELLERPQPQHRSRRSSQSSISTPGATTKSPGTRSSRRERDKTSSKSQSRQQASPPPVDSTPRSDTSSLQARVHELLAENENLKAQQREHSEYRSHTEDELATLRVSSAQAQSDRDEAQLQLEAARNEITALRDRIAQLETTRGPTSSPSGRPYSGNISDLALRDEYQQFATSFVIASKGGSIAIERQLSDVEALFLRIQSLRSQCTLDRQNYESAKQRLESELEECKLRCQKAERSAQVTPTSRKKLNDLSTALAQERAVHTQLSADLLTAKEQVIVIERQKNEAEQRARDTMEALQKLRLEYQDLCQRVEYAQARTAALCAEDASQLESPSLLPEQSADHSGLTYRSGSGELPAEDRAQLTQYSRRRSTSEVQDTVASPNWKNAFIPPSPPLTRSRRTTVSASPPTSAKGTGTGHTDSRPGQRPSQQPAQSPQYDFDMARVQEALRKVVPPAVADEVIRAHQSDYGRGSQRRQSAADEPQSYPADQPREIQPEAVSPARQGRLPPRSGPSPTIPHSTEYSIPKELDERERRVEYHHRGQSDSLDGVVVTKPGPRPMSGGMASPVAPFPQASPHESTVSSRYASHRGALQGTPDAQRQRTPVQSVDPAGMTPTDRRRAAPRTQAPATPTDRTPVQRRISSAGPAPRGVSPATYTQFASSGSLSASEILLGAAESDIELSNSSGVERFHK